MAEAMKAGSLQNIKTLPIDAVEPYWRNPRRITSEAVNAIAESITRYGYLQPVVVDSDNVIIIGHTRFAAMKRLGYTELTVAVETQLDPIAVKQLRTIDNRVGEFTTWDFEKLIAEIDTLDADQLRSYFPEILPQEVEDLDRVLQNAQVDAKQEERDHRNATVEFVCPSCFHGWEQQVTKTDIMSGMIGGAK